MEKCDDAKAKFEKLKEQYLHDINSNDAKKALEYALEIRKFEISLYWKRAAYFWAFIAAIFAAYFALHDADFADSKLILGITLVGYIFTWCWYLVNRGSKFWQDNWEMHVDFLEDAVIGSLYKTVKNPQSYRFNKLLDGYPFSVTRINLVLNMTILIVWIVLFLANLTIVFNQYVPDLSIFLGIIFLLIISTIIALLTRSKLPRNEESALYINRKSEIAKKYCEHDDMTE